MMGLSEGTPNSKGSSSYFAEKRTVAVSPIKQTHIRSQVASIPYYVYIYIYIIIIYFSYSGGSLLLGQTMYIYFVLHISIYFYIFISMSIFFYILLYVSIYIMCVDISHDCFGPSASLRIAAASPGLWRLGTRASQKMEKIGKNGKLMMVNNG